MGSTRFCSDCLANLANNGFSPGAAETDGKKRR